MKRAELLLPAGDGDCLRAAVHNGADAVYLGLDAHNARRFAGNFSRGTLRSVVQFCHGEGVRVHVTANTLVKNAELADYLSLVSAIGASEADAVIMQDPWLIPLAREAAPGCEIHLSTQATTANPYAVPDSADRVILPRETGLAEIAEMAKAVPSEVFVHGALCLSYSGQCLFSSIAGGRSGNRGRCAQPCRRQYGGSYPLSTKDLCLLERLPEVIATGVVALKVEGRMRSPLYVGTAARIYRKYVDMHYGGNFAIDPHDAEDLMLAFSRDFTQGFAFTDSVVDASASTSRGVPLGVIEGGRIKLEAELAVGDGVMALDGARRTGNTVKAMLVDGVPVERACRGDVVSLEVVGSRDGDRIYKNASASLVTGLSKDFEIQEGGVKASAPALPRFPASLPDGPASLFVRVANPGGAAEADAGGASIVYYDIFAEDLEEAKNAVKDAKFFLSTPRVMSRERVDEAMRIISRVKPAGILAGERGLPALMKRQKSTAEIHLDVSHNIFNDVDISTCGGIPVISPELSFDELASLSSKRFIAMVHGPLVLMTTREPLVTGTMTDEAGRVFRVRKRGELTEVLNCSDLGLFNLARNYLGIGVKWFFLDLDRDVAKYMDIYKKILAGAPFDDKRVRRGHTTGHFRRGVE